MESLDPAPIPVKGTLASHDAQANALDKLIKDKVKASVSNWCKDETAECPSWADEGFCEGEMKQTLERICLKSCGYCAEESASVEQQGTNAAEKAAEPDTAQTSGGATTQAAGVASSVVSAQTSSVTTAIDANTGGLTPCQDRSKHCAEWSRGNFCTDSAMKITMESMCQKSCNLCIVDKGVATAAATVGKTGVADVSPMINTEPRSSSKGSISPTAAPLLSSEGLVQVDVTGPTAVTFKMHVHSKPEVISGHIRRTHATFEVDKCKQMLKHFQAARVNRESNLFIDVGGNIGSHTFCLASAGVRVLAFEALPLNANVLFNTVKYNNWSPQVQVVPKAAGATSPSPPLCMRGGHAESENMGAFSAVDPASNPFKHIKGWHAELPCTMIETSTVDAEVERISRERSMCPLVMKLDIEGYEHFALMGAQKTLSRLMPCAIYMVSVPCCRLQALWHGA